MGIVFLARDLALERHVAIKLLPLTFSGDERMRARFVREARTAARLSHPNIVPIHSVEENADIVFFVMNYVDGETLTSRVRRGGPLDASDGSRLVQELAWALAYAHSAGVIHRDVKPDNVMIDRASGRAMLTDFGIARVGESDASHGELVGTAHFVSPEQASGSTLDGRSDLYSLGITAFFALTGRLPFEAPTAMGVIGMHISKPAPPIATARASLRPKLCAAVDRCLSKNPVDRFATGEELAEAIGDARATEPEVAPAVRAFLRDRTRMTNELVLLFFAAQYLGAFAHVSAWRIVAPLGALAVASIGRLFRTARRLLRAGYGFDDVRAALEEDLIDKREELGVELLSSSGEARLQFSAGVRAVGIVAIVMGALAAGSSVGTGRMTVFLLGALAMAGGALLVHTAGPMPARAQRQQLLSRWFDRLWQGQLGQSFFVIAALPDRPLAQRIRRLFGGAAKESTEAASPPVSAPTEERLARSAKDLLDALPTRERAQFESARVIVERLRDKIANLRDREVQLAAAIADAVEVRATVASSTTGTRQSLEVRREEFAMQLERARDDAATRRASAVVALENIRLQLLRLRAGLGSPKDLTIDLDAAARIEQQIDAAIDEQTA